MVAEEHDAEADEQDEDFTAGLEGAPESDSDQSDDDKSDDDKSDDDKSDDDKSDDDKSDDDKSDDDDSKKAEKEAPEKKKTPKEESEEGEPGDDHPDAIGALKDLGARLDLNKHERVWRIFLYETHGDETLEQIHGLSSLKELWLLHTRVTSEGAEKVRERLEGVTVYYG